MRLRAAALVAMLAAPAVARADHEDVAVRRLEFREKGKNLAVSGSFTDVFDQEMLEQLDSGYATNVVLRAYVYEKNDPEVPVWSSAATFRVVYDLWDEEYLVQVRDAQGERTDRYATRADALKAATTLASFPLAPLDAVPIGPHHFAALIIELNPVSDELLAEVRKWMARPQGATEVAGNSSFFGSFVSIFMNPKIAEADRTLRFRSQLFYRVKR